MSHLTCELVEDKPFTYPTQCWNKRIAKKMLTQSVKSTFETKLVDKTCRKDVNEMKAKVHCNRISRFDYNLEQMN